MKTYQRDFHGEKEYSFYVIFAQVYGEFGNVYSKLNRIDDAKKAYETAIEFAKNVSGFDSAGKAFLGELYYNFAGFYKKIKEYVNSEQYYSKALEIETTLDNYQSYNYKESFGLFDIYCGLADLYANAKKYEDAEAAYNLAIETEEKKKDNARNDLALSNACNRLANIYSITEKYEPAEKNYKIAIEIREKIADGDLSTKKRLGLEILYRNLANNYKKMGQFEEEKKCLEKAELIEKGAIKNDQISNLLSLFYK